MMIAASSPPHFRPPLVTDLIDSRSRHAKDEGRKNKLKAKHLSFQAAGLGVHVNEKAAGVEEACRKPNKRTRVEFKVCPHIFPF